MRISYELRRGDYKNATIRVSRGGEVFVSVPGGWSDEKVRELLESKKPWLEKILKKTDELNRTRISVPKGSVLYLGEIYSFERSPAMGKNVRIDDKNLVISSGTNLRDPANLKKFYSERAAFLLPARTARWAEATGKKPSKVSVRDARKRWGSCSSRRAVTLSSRLVLAPWFVIDAIICHELVHTEIMNHSPAFYEALSEIYPGYKEAEEWLDKKYPAVYPPSPSPD